MDRGRYPTSSFWQGFEKSAVTQGWIADRVESGLRGRRAPEDKLEAVREAQEGISRAQRKEDPLVTKSRKRNPAAQRSVRYQSLPKTERKNILRGVRELRNQFRKGET